MKEEDESRSERRPRRSMSQIGGKVITTTASEHQLLLRPLSQVTSLPLTTVMKSEM